MSTTIGQIIADLGMATKDPAIKAFVAETIDTGKPLSELENHQIRIVGEAAQNAALVADARRHKDLSEIIGKGRKYANADLILDGLLTTRVLIGKRILER